MGKIVKYCAECEEGFAAKFAFCPNCGGALTAYEMNPLTAAAETPPAGDTVASKVNPLPPVPAETPAIREETVEPETVAFSSNQTEEKILDDEYLPEETAAFTAGAGGESGYVHDDVLDDDRSYEPQTYQSSGFSQNAAIDDGYHITVIEEKNSGARNALLLGSWLLVMTLTLGGVVYSLYAKDFDLSGVGDYELMSAMMIDDPPTQTEPEPPKPKEDKGGGGGGGGKEEEDPVSKGTPPRQTEVQLNPPTSKVPQFEAELKYDMSTVGKRDIKRTEDPIGDINGQSYKLSDGRGRGGGMGSGTGTGFGSGRGTGAGSGVGSGNGDGFGDGDGDGTGPGGGGAPPPIKPKEPVGPPTPVKILAKPKALYTDAARTNNVQGVVRVRVTLLASGQIGSVSPVNSLGYGLTEQALAAARQIRFEPAKKGGQPVTTTKIFEYTFTMY